MIYKLYRFFSCLLYPFLKLLLCYRVVKGKEDKGRYLEKLGFYKLARPKGKLIWFHAASIGEFNAILPIILFVAQKHNILLTTVTLTAAKIAKANLPQNAIHQFMPFDSLFCVKRFLKYWHPDLIIWTESEIWPNIIFESKAPKILINARISQKSFRRWSYFKNFASQILNNFTLILAQSEETKYYLEQLGFSNSEFLGNLKYVASNFNYDKQELEHLRKEAKDRLIIMAASTHHGEEAMIKSVHLLVKQKYPHLLTIIAPRHVERAKAILSDLEGLKVALRSKKEAITKETDILLVDTIGEFGLFYRLSKIVCMGGSWKRIAHSFLEPAKLGNLIIMGPNIDNSREIAECFIKGKAAIFAVNEKEIAQAIKNYLDFPEESQEIINNASKIVEEMNQVKDKVIAKLAPFTDNL